MKNHHSPQRRRGAERKCFLLALLVLCVSAPLRLIAQVPTVWFTNLLFTGSTNDTTINIKARSNPFIEAGTFYWMFARGTNFTSSNGVVGVRLLPGDYTAAFAGVPVGLQLHVTNSAVDLNAADLMTNIVRYSGVETLTGQGSVSVVPPTGPGGNWIIIGTGGGGALASNAFVTVAGNNLVNVSSNNATLTFTISPVAQTNENMRLWSLATPIAYSNAVIAFADGRYDPISTAAAIGLQATNYANSLVAAASNHLNGTNLFGALTNNTTGNATTATTSTQLENRGTTLNGFTAAISTAGNNGFHITDADGSAMGITGGGIILIYTNASGVSCFEIRDIANNTMFKIMPTNLFTLTLTVTNLGDGANTNLAGADKNGNAFPISLGSGLTYNAGTKTLSAPSGGGGNVSGTGSSSSGQIAVFNNGSATGIASPGFTTNSWDDAGLAYTVGAGNTNLTVTSSNVVQVTTTNIYYVETTGDDSKAIAGFKNRPWRNFTNALAAITGKPAILSLGVGTFFTDPSTNGSIIPSNVSIEGKGEAQTFLLPGNLSQATTNANGPYPFGIVFSGDNIELSRLTLGTNSNNGTYYLPLGLAQGTNEYIHDMAITGDSDAVYGNANLPSIMNTNCSGRIEDVRVLSGFHGIVMLAIGRGTNSTWRISNTRINITGDVNFPSPAQNAGLYLGHITNTVQNCNITVNSPGALQVAAIYVIGSGVTNNLTLANNVISATGPGAQWVYVTGSRAVTQIRGLLDSSQLTANGSVVNWDTIQSTNVIGLLDASALTASHHLATGPTTNLISSEDATGYINTIAWTHEGTTTNITAAFNGTLQSFTCTNGPSTGQDYFFHYAGTNGSCSYRFSGSAVNTLHFDYQPKWLAGSNSVITNGVLSFTSYGGTNAADIEAAMGENQ